MNFGSFVGSFHGAQSRKASDERAMNLYLERVVQENPAAMNENALWPTPGFRTFVTPTPGAGRGLFSQNDRSFAVVGDQLIEVFADGTSSHRPLTTLADFADAPTVTPSPPTPALPQPGPPLIQQGGAIGGTVYGYKIAATNAHGSSLASLEGTIATGAAALDDNDFNHISWPEIAGATGYKVYRTTGGVAPPKLIATITDPSILFAQDTGQAGSVEVPPAVDTSAQAVGAETWGYKVAAVIGLGQTAASAEGQTATGYAALTDVNFHTVAWAAVANAQSYQVWRVTGPGVTTPLLIGTVSGVTEFKDTGQAGEATLPPAANTTTSMALIDDGAPVSISSSGDAGQQLFIVGAGKGYVLDLRTNVFAQVVEGVTFGDYLEGYFVALDAGTSTLKWSGILNGFRWTDTDYQQRVAGADKWIGMAVHNKEIWLVGTQSTEVWVHTGAPEPAAPFSPIDSVFIEKGIGAAFSLMKVETSLFWLAQDKNGSGMIVRTEGYGVVRVSTHGLEDRIRAYRTVADAEAWTYQDLGHTFYVLSFPTEGHTWVYDLSTREWHERGHWAALARDWTVYRPRAHAFAFSGLTRGLHLVIDRETGVIYEMASTLGTDVDGRPIIRQRRAPHITNNQKDVTHDELEIVLDPDLVPISGNGSDPTAMLRWSNDSGSTWSNEHWRGTGKLGRRLARVRWQCLGSARSRQYELTLADPIPWRIIGARLELRSSVH